MNNILNKVFQDENLQVHTFKLLKRGEHSSKWKIGIVERTPRGHEDMVVVPEVPCMRRLPSLLA